MLDRLPGQILTNWEAFYLVEFAEDPKTPKP